jgi:hypothetical protein
MFFSQTFVLMQFVALFATAFACEGTAVGETSHSLLTGRIQKLSLIDGKLSRLLLGANAEL